jgi:cysteine desulfurase family protein (TIGR01976 family)
MGGPMSGPGLQMEEVRSMFPALERREAGKRAAYFDGPGGTQVPHRVIDGMVRYLEKHNANTHWAFRSSRETDALLSEARARYGDFLGCSAGEVVFGANMTSLTFHLSRALGRGMGPGDEIVVTELDHHANVAPWTALAQERGVTVRVAPMRPESGTLDHAALEALIGPKTRLVAIGRASNALGTITELGDVIETAHRNGAQVFVDAVHSAAHERTDVRELDCDFLGCSPYKFYGPHLGVLYVRGEVLNGLDVAKLEPASDRGPERMETGTLPHEAVVAAGEAVEFLAELGGHGLSHTDGEAGLGDRGAALDRSFALLHQRGDELGTRMWEGLERVSGVTLYGPPPPHPRTPTIGFVVEGTSSTEVASRLSSDFGVFVSHGDFYATTLVQRLGLGAEGLVRAGAACYTTEDEVDRLIAGVHAIAGGA